MACVYHVRTKGEGCGHVKSVQGIYGFCSKTALIFMRKKILFNVLKC